MAFTGAEVLPTGIIRFTLNQGVYLGELPTGTSARVQTLGDTLERVGIVAHVTSSIQSLEWSKYVSWVCSMAPAVLTRLETYKLLQDAQIASIVAAILQEMTQLATARAIVLEDLPFFPTQTLSALSVDAMVTQLRQIGDRWASLMPHNKMSILQDVERGKRLEVEETLGYAVQQGARWVYPCQRWMCYNLIAGINHYLQ